MIKKCAIIGLPGSGKSTFAMRLGKILDIPVHHLDVHMFDSNGQKVDKQKFLMALDKMLTHKKWIIEGCSISTLEMRFAKADTIIYFRFSRLLCIGRLLKRVWIRDQALLSTGCANTVNWLLLKYIWNFKKEKESAIEALHKQYPHVNFLVFKTPKQSTQYILSTTSLNIE